MARSTVFEGRVSYLQVLDPQGRIDRDAAANPPLDRAGEFFEAMLRTRRFDERAFLLQREGRIGTYAQSLGQEAAMVGSAAALEDRDWIVPSYRECGSLLLRGIPPENLLAYWGGDERGMLGFRERRCLPYAIPVGTQIPHATGLAYALSQREAGAACLCYFGDGATSTGDFHEGLNFAAVLRAPVVFFCQNNGWAISVPRERQCAAETLAQKAWGYGIEGLQVDGNDVFACFEATREALERARRGDGPTFIEALTYRLADHTTADDARRYRDESELAAWRERDPLLRLRRWLESEGPGWSAEHEQERTAAIDRELDAAVAGRETMPKAPPIDMLRHLYAVAEEPH